jgi:hypothetical protein
LGQELQWFFAPQFVQLLGGCVHFDLGVFRLHLADLLLQLTHLLQSFIGSTVVDFSLHLLNHSGINLFS